jgi:hypothetical protein
MMHVAHWHVASVSAMQRYVPSWNRSGLPADGIMIAGLGVDLDAPQFHSEATSA